MLLGRLALLSRHVLCKTSGLSVYPHSMLSSFTLTVKGWVAPQLTLPAPHMYLVTSTVQPCHLLAAALPALQRCQIWHQYMCSCTCATSMSCCLLMLAHRGHQKLNVEILVRPCVASLPFALLTLPPAFAMQQGRDFILAAVQLTAKAGQLLLWQSVPACAAEC